MRTRQQIKVRKSLNLLNLELCTSKFHLVFTSCTIFELIKRHVIFSHILCFSWLPFCIFSISSEIWEIFVSSGKVILIFDNWFSIIRNLESLMTAYMICNLIGLSSTCTNPILYGYLNKNIQEILMRSISDFLYVIKVGQIQTGDLSQKAEDWELQTS